MRTKNATVELSEKLEARGYASAALNGDIAQKQRERTVHQLKSGKLDILVATDVAARGLDVERISHVINYDVPYDTESYIHRIGRTGRAGRSGDAILFIAPREKRMLHSIEKATNKKIDLMELPSTELINDKRVAKFTQRITDTLAKEELEFFTQLLEQYQQEHNVPVIEIAAALAKLAQGDTPLLIKHKPIKPARSERERKPGPKRERDSRREKKPASKHKSASKPEEGMFRYRLEVGHNHDVKPGNIVGAIAGETGLDSEHIGKIDIHDDYSTVDLPDGMPKDIFQTLRKTWVSGQQLKISRLDDGDKPMRSKSKDNEPVRSKSKDDKKRKPGKIRIKDKTKGKAKPKKLKPKKTKSKPKQ